MEENLISKQEKRELRREKKEGEAARVGRRRLLRKIIKISVPLILSALLIGGLIWYFRSQPAISGSDIITKNGIHSHPELLIYIKGKKQVIPANIGISAFGENPIHTHDDMGVIHLEFSGIVKKTDTRLAKFFEVWGKQFSANCVFDKCNGPDGRVKMFVNGVPNSDFGNYEMKDGDKIEIRYE